MKHPHRTMEEAERDYGFRPVPIPDVPIGTVVHTVTGQRLRKGRIYKSPSLGVWCATDVDTGKEDYVDRGMLVWPERRDGGGVSEGMYDGLSPVDETNVENAQCH